MQWLVILAALLLLSWLVAIYLILRIKRKARKKIHKLRGRLAIRNHETAKAVLNEEEKFRKLIGQMNEGLLLTDASHKIVFANPCACGILKISQEKIIGRKLTDFVLGSSESALLEQAMNSRNMGCATREEVQMVRKNDDIFWGSLSISFPKDLNELTGGAIVVLVDVSSHRALESKLQKLTHGLVQKIKQLNCMFDIQQLVSDPSLDMDAVFRKSLIAIPQGMRFGRDVGVEIFFLGKKYSTTGYRKTGWHFEAPIKANYKKVGYLAISYLGPVSRMNKNPFGIGQKALLRNIADKLAQAALTREQTTENQGG